MPFTQKLLSFVFELANGDRFILLVHELESMVPGGRLAQQVPFVSNPGQVAV
jgi:hypothetical protein